MANKKHNDSQFGKLRQNKIASFVVIAFILAGLIFAYMFIIGTTLTQYEDGDGNMYECSQQIKARKGTESALIGHEQGLVPVNKADADKYCRWVGIE